MCKSPIVDSIGTCHSQAKPQKLHLTYECKRETENVQVVFLRKTNSYKKNVINDTKSCPIQLESGLLVSRK